jgi:hypothetical protein
MSDDMKTRVEKTLEANGFAWGVSRDIANAINRLSEDHPDSVIEVTSTSSTGNKISSSEVVIRIKTNTRGSDE